jgi:hypothetical protein
MPPPSTAFTLISGSDYYYALFRTTKFTNLHKGSEAISPCNAVRLWLTHVGGGGSSECQEGGSYHSNFSRRPRGAGCPASVASFTGEWIPRYGRWGRQLIPIHFVHARARLHHWPRHCSKACFGIYWSWAVAFDLMPSMVAKRLLEAAKSHWKRDPESAVAGYKGWSLWGLYSAMPLQATETGCSL